MTDPIAAHPSDGWRVEPRTGHHRRRFVVAGEDYDVAVALPAERAAEPLPLLFALDGALHFDALAAAALALARRPEKTGVGPLIVVGIASGPDWSHDRERRARDYVPDEHRLEAGPERAGRPLLRAIADDILPAVGGLVPVDPARTTIFGHSLGGLFALDALTHGAFAGAVAISPSLWRLPGLIAGLGARLAPGLAPRLNESGRSVLLTSGEYEPRINPDLIAAHAELARHGPARLAILPGEDHGSAPFAAIPAALRFASTHRFDRS